MRTTAKRWKWATGLVALALVGAACGGSEDGSDEGASSGEGTEATTGGSSAEPVTLRLGYFPNITHATALVGVRNGIFEKNLGENVTLETATFNAGPAAIEALLGEAVDASFIGPNPAINAYAQSDGKAIRIVAGATSGGAFLVAKPEIAAVADLRGKRIATPQLGNTQDVALRAYLAEQGLETNPRGGGDVSIVPQENAQTLETFRSGDVDGAWVPEPWATRLVQEGGGKVLVDERDLWTETGGQYVTTHLIVRTEFLEDNPEAVEALLRGHVEATDFVTANTDEAQRVANEAIGEIAGRPLSDAVIEAAWPNLTFTVDPVAESLRESAKDAETVGLLEPVDLEGIYDLSLLNKVLAAGGKAEIQP